MTRIGNIQSNLGDGVYSMIHDSCKYDSHTEFVVNTVKPFNDRVLAGYKTIAQVGLWVLRVACGAILLGLLSLLGSTIQHAIVGKASIDIFGK